ncbi:Surface antigen [Anaplasma phagocytophilum]|nr:Surface antigen [Anaplasma phagocytophilum]
MLVAMEGSVGYGIGGARVELEIGYERFKIKGIRDSGSKEDEADTVYLLAKELAYDVVNSQADKLGDALAKYKGEDIVKFAEALNISNSKIDGKICSKEHATGTTTASGGYKAEPNSTYTAQCSNLKGYGEAKNESLSSFVKKVELKDKNWPTGKIFDSNTKDGETRGNAKAVATDLVALNSDEKTIVAGLLAKTIEGGEVVEIRAVSSTSVMVNACYDLLSEGLGVVPYACVGLGGIVDGHITNYAIFDPVCS